MRRSPSTPPSGRGGTTRVSSSKSSTEKGRQKKRSRGPEPWEWTPEDKSKAFLWAERYQVEEANILKTTATLILIALLIPTMASSAPPAREVVQASEILASIERGEPVFVNNLIVEGDLDYSGFEIDLSSMMGVGVGSEAATELLEAHQAERPTLISSPIAITNSEIRGDVRFDRITFIDSVNFAGTSFTGNASFDEARFEDQAAFLYAKFRGDASFKAASFNDRAYFSGDHFGGRADFEGAQFKRLAGFSYAKFSEEADFQGARFGNEACFGGAQFKEDADFGGTEFGGFAYFGRARFSGSSSLGEARFADIANFYSARLADAGQGG